MNQSYIVYAAPIALIFLGAVLFVPYVSSFPTVAKQLERSAGRETITLDGNTIHVSVADTLESRARGLGGREGLAPDEGMLFIFPKDGDYAFWMKDMRFSIDILWLSVDGEVIYSIENLSPATYPRSFVSQRPARYVLELPTGYVEAHRVKEGDIVRL